MKDLYLLEEVEQVFTFGHVADGNIHLVVGKKEDGEELTHCINNIVFSPLKIIGGSVSAEHGIGTHKKEYLSICRSPEEIALMKTLKTALDPYGILNPGKIL